MLGGDWNRPPESVAGGNLPGTLNATVIVPDGPTCYPSIGDPSLLDLFLMGACIAALNPKCTRLEDTAIPAHRPIVLSFALTGTQDMVRTIRLPREIEEPEKPKSGEDTGKQPEGKEAPRSAASKARLLTLEAACQSIQTRARRGQPEDPPSPSQTAAPY